MYQNTAGNDQDDDQANRLLHELANDLAAIQMRADILISVATASESSLPPMKTDLVILRATAQHEITLTEEFALVFIGPEPSALDRPNV